MVKNKKALSAMIGYILLVTFGIVMAIIVFNYLQTYVPKDIGTCPDGTSLFLKEYSYNCTSGELRISLKNNGRFNIGGFFIHGSNQSEAKVATIDLSKNVKDIGCTGENTFATCGSLSETDCGTSAYCSYNGSSCLVKSCSEVGEDYCNSHGCDWTTARLYGNAVVVNISEENLFKPNQESNYIFENLEGYGEIQILNINPMRFQEKNNVVRPISCGQAKITETLDCD